MTSAVSNTTSSGGVPASLLNAVNPKATKATDSVQADTDKFMTLLITQLKNQDPLNPLDNAQVTSQLAQLSTVTGINKLNETMNTLQGNYQLSSQLQATSLIDHGVLIEGSDLTLKDGKSIFGVEFGSAADAARIDIVNASGKVVHSLAMNSGVDAGVIPLTWDGTLEDGSKAPDGKYSVKLTAVAGDQTLKDAKPLTFTTVSSVSTGAGGLKLNLPIGQVTMDQIKQVL
ncbi:MAG TPA: flagellar hook assembly protein FlgD [Pseudoduganella sp.]